MKNIGFEDLKLAIIGASKNLETNKEYVNGLNVFPVPDGDTGTNMSLTMKSVRNKLESAEPNMKSVAKALSTGSLMGARGNSGVILSQLCRGAAKVFEQVETVEIINVVEAFESARDTAYKAVLKPTEGTILTVSRMIAEFARENFLKYDDILVFINDCIDAGKDALKKTPEMLPVLKEANVVDAGGQGLIFLLEGAYRTLNGEEVIDNLTDSEVMNINLNKHVEHDSTVRPEDIVYGYCTEFLILTDGTESYEDFRDEISPYGDSIVAVGTDDMIKIHIHTDDPGFVLGLARKKGELTGIKIENMRLQNAEVIRLKEEQEKAAKKENKKKYGFVSVSIGEGFDEIFNDLGIDKLIKGGQTMNPSTEDIVDAVNSVNAENVFIFPNNKNIILAAKQAVELVDNNLIVIETKSIPQAFTAMINFDDSKTATENWEAMTESLKEVTSLQLTYAIRDTKSGDLDIEKDDYIGLENGDIVVKGKDMNDTFKDLIKHAVTDESGIISIYYGEDISETEAVDLQEELEKEYPLVDIELYNGGQPLYYYIAAIE